MPDLKDDLLPTIDAISTYTGEPVRRLRHVISRHGFPAKKVGGKIQSRKSWIDAYYAEPDTRPAKTGAGK
ncbi:MAG: hypothetical protein ACREJ5_12235 [Geminicoccaceae bacterium]